ncbi:MAG: hypothetical protein Q8P18_18410 [Pseudomonadota bacterium]|nr:hypothetical protein [Pseudomonadota bacterium]
MSATVLDYHRAALRAGEAGDLRALVSLAGHVAQAARLGVAMPPEVKWLWDPSPILETEPPMKAAPLSLGGPELLHLWEDETRHPEVERWLGHALSRMYRGDWGPIARGDEGANERSLIDGSRLMGVFPWFGKTPTSDDKSLWVFVEAAHGEDVRFRRVSLCHRNDY